jgi:hypothetical protein
MGALRPRWANSNRGFPDLRILRQGLFDTQPHVVVDSSFAATPKTLQMNVYISQVFLSPLFLIIQINSSFSIHSIIQYQSQAQNFERRRSHKLLPHPICLQSRTMSIAVSKAPSRKSHLSFLPSWDPRRFSLRLLTQVFAEPTFTTSHMAPHLVTKALE